MFVRNLIYLGFLAMIAGSCSTVEPTATDLEGSQPVPEATTTAEPSAKLTLEEALKTAYDTSVLTQTAKTTADWEQVQQGWQSAIDQLATIPESSEQYGQAQQKISDYQKNLAYALQELDKARQFSAPVFMTLTAEATADPRVVIRGETNLPDGSEILISMDNNLGASFQDKAMVTQGKFETTLGPPAGLETAQYSIDAVFSPFAQSEEVQAIVGRKGEKLTGNLVSTSTLIEGLKIASTDPINLLIGDAVAVSNSDAANQELVKQVYSSAQGLLAQAKAMQPLRESSDPSKQSQCVTRMRELQKQVEVLDQQAQQLSQQYVLLKAAITALEIGVTCDADIAPDFIAEAESDLQQVSDLVP